MKRRVACGVGFAVVLGTFACGDGAAEPQAQVPPDAMPVVEYLEVALPRASQGQSAIGVALGVRSVDAVVSLQAADLQFESLAGEVFPSGFTTARQEMFPATVGVQGVELRWQLDVAPTAPAGRLRVVAVLRIDDFELRESTLWIVDRPARLVLVPPEVVFEPDVVGIGGQTTMRLHLRNEGDAGARVLGFTGGSDPPVRGASIGFAPGGLLFAGESTGVAEIVFDLPPTAPGDYVFTANLEYEDLNDPSQIDTVGGAASITVQE